MTATSILFNSGTFILSASSAVRYFNKLSLLTYGQLPLLSLAMSIVAYWVLIPLFGKINTCSVIFLGRYDLALFRNKMLSRVVKSLKRVGAQFGNFLYFNNMSLIWIEQSIFVLLSFWTYWAICMRNKKMFMYYSRNVRKVLSYFAKSIEILPLK